MNHHTLQGSILTPNGLVDGQLSFGTHIGAIDTAPRSATRRYLLPGFIDLHVHGGGGVDIMEGGASAVAVARMHARHGTTSMLGTTMTASEADISGALRGLAPAIAVRQPGSARLLGVHLEGPFISINRLGAQPEAQVRQATLELVRRYHALAPIRVLTLAPEVDDHLALIPQLCAMGIRVQIGHSNGSYEQGLAALRAGASGFTHLFNGMTGLNQYAPGMVGAALAHAEFSELIPDLQHVHPGAIRAAMRAIPRLYCVTDATSATGMPDGEYALGTQRVVKCQGCVRLRSGSLAGSALTMDQALRNLLQIGCDLADASRRLSLHPADYLGVQDRGRLQTGAWADVVVLDADFQVQQVYVEGEPILR
ncbi:MAG: N-acetylglucosamine-6-phosphate deacetylase [Pseudomonadota bacterium]